MPQDNPALAQVRQRIDALDDEVLRLISERARAAQQVAQIKMSQEPGAPFYRPEREAEVLRRIRERNPGPLDSDAVARLFREIMSSCLALEQPQSVAYLGPEGTFTHAAVLKQFGRAVVAKSLDSISAVFREVEAGATHFGVVPVENSTEGMITHTLDMFLHSPLKICGEVSLRIHQNLVAKGLKLEDVRQVVSHQQSLAQCRQWLDHHLPHVELVPVFSNAEAARMAAVEPGVAAIAGVTAAEIYGLDLLVAKIEDDPNNTTRFLVIGPRSVDPSGQDKTSLLLSCHNRSGALHRLLSPLAEHGISMTRIESRPSRRGAWDYVFFVDIEGHCQDSRLVPALQALEAEASLYRVLGSYPRSVMA